MKFSIHHHLIGLVLIAVIPVVIFSSGLIVYLAEQRSQALENHILSTTKVLITAVDENITSVATSLKILAESEGFEADTVQYLHKRLRKFVHVQQQWDHISFVDTRGVQIFNTSESFGKKLPRLQNEIYFKQMMKSGDIAISGFQRKSGLITVAVPVKKNGIIIYALIGTLKLSSFNKLLKSQTLPRNWTAAILDENMIYLAHSRNESFTGKKASELFRQQMRKKGDYGFSYINGEGAETFAATAVSKITGWKIILRIPDDGHLFTSWKSIIYIVTGGSLLLCLSIFVAILLSRRISKPLLSLSQSAQALGQGRPIKRIKTSLQEVTEVNEALIKASVERSMNEEKIKQLYDRANEAVKIRDTFMSIASHELKTPITTLKLQFQMLYRLINKQDLIPAKDLIRPMSRVDNVVSRLIDLIDDLLDVTRISAGKLNYNPEPVELVPFVNEIIDDLIEEAHKKGSVINFHPMEKIHGLWDKHRLEQVIINLITNAIKYGDSGPIDVLIKKEADQAVVEVRDYGLGISQENLNKIFERFERVGNIHASSGLGLGLWIVKKILEGFGGSISVESKLNEGSIFRVCLPINVQSSDSLYIMHPLINSGHSGTETFGAVLSGRSDQSFG